MQHVQLGVEGDTRQLAVQRENKDAAKQGTASLPHVTLAPISSPGPAGDNTWMFSSPSLARLQRRRLFRVLGVLTAKWAGLGNFRLKWS